MTSEHRVTSYAERLTIANVFESRIADYVYEAGNTEQQLCTRLGGRFIPSISTEAPFRKTYVCTFPDESWVIGTTEECILASGITKPQLDAEDCFPEAIAVLG